MGVDLRCTCKELFKKLNILHIPCVCVFSLLMFIRKNCDNFLTNTDIYGVSTRTKHQLNRPTVTLSCTQRGVFYSGIKIFNKLPPHILQLKNETQRFMVALRKYIITHVFYSVDEFLSSS